MSPHEISRDGRDQGNPDAYEQAVAADLAARPALTQRQSVAADGVVWLTVHGLVALALRHPGIGGAAAATGELFLAQLGEGLVAWGILTPEELAQHLADQAAAELERDQYQCERCGCTAAQTCGPEGCGWNQAYLQEGRVVCTACAPERRILTPYDV